MAYQIASHFTTGNSITGNQADDGTKFLIMQEFIIISILVVIAGIFIVLRTKQKNDKENPPHTPLR